MAKYRYPCPQCGSVALVSVEQAGADWTCPECHAKSALPTMMQMRRLEPDDPAGVGGATDTARIERARSRRGLGAGFVGFGILLALACVAGMAVFGYVRTSIPTEEPDYGAYLEQTSDNVMAMSAGDAFDSWTQIRDLDLNSRSRMTPYHIANRQQRSAMGTAMAICLGGIAVAAASILAGVVFLRGSDPAKGVPSGAKR